MKSFFEKFRSMENEFTKKWIARFTIIVFILLLFYPALSQELLFFHFKKGLSYNMCNMVMNSYCKFAVVLVSGYAVTFITSMGKAYLAKQQEEANKLQLKLAGKEDEGEMDNEDIDDDI